jgi:hypothetical protein
MFGQRWDYVVLGSVGFSQLGVFDCEARWEVEREVLCDWIADQVIPEEWSKLAYLTIKYFNHDFGRYGEVVLKYHESVRDWEWQDGKEDEYDRFWEWVNSLESFDFETLYDECDSRFVAAMHVVHKQEEFSGLKKVI